MNDYRIRWTTDGQAQAVVVHVDPVEATIAMEMPDGTSVTIDEVAGRAILVLLNQAVFLDLRSAGPWLRIERRHEDSWEPYGPRIPR